MMTMILLNAGSNSGELLQVTLYGLLSGDGTLLLEPLLFRKHACQPPKFPWYGQISPS